jgi:hypothetical protein
MTIPSVGPKLLHVDGQPKRDKTKLTVAFRNAKNAFRTRKHDVNVPKSQSHMLRKMENNANRNCEVVKISVSESY